MSQHIVFVIILFNAHFCQYYCVTHNNESTTSDPNISSEEFFHDLIVDNTILMDSLSGECESRFMQSAAYESCKSRALNAVVNGTRYSRVPVLGKAHNNTDPQSHCCLNWLLLDCFSAHLAYLCPDVWFDPSETEWLDIVETQHNCAKLGLPYRRRGLKCQGLYARDDSTFKYYHKHHKNQVLVNDWKVFLVAIIITCAVILVIVVRKRYEHYKMSRIRYFRPLSVIHYDQLRDQEMCQISGNKVVY